MEKSNENLSLPKVKKIHNVQVRKMPCGQYFNALQTLKNLPEKFIKELCPNEKYLSEMFTTENIIKSVTKLLIILPDFTFNFLSELIGIDEDIIRNELTPKELIDIVQEFWKINELESFFEEMKSMMNKIMMLIGFKKQ